jgi:hypothetical protein
VEIIKANIRAHVAYPFWHIKQIFGYSTMHYRGLAKNTNRLNFPILALSSRG